MPTILILGATSDIARASAAAFAREGWEIWLAGRNMDRLNSAAQDLAVRFRLQVPCFRYDVLETGAHNTLWHLLPAVPDAILCAVGILGDQESAQHDPGLADLIMQTNFTGLLPILSLAADSFAERGSGAIIGLSSVAGDRGRASNYVYGSAKAGLTAYLSGLRNRLAGKGVNVLTVKPGFVKTAMTDGMNLPPALTAEPRQVGDDIVVAVKKGKNIIYSRWFWRYIMTIIKLIPESIFKKLKL